MDPRLFYGKHKNNYVCVPPVPEVSEDEYEDDDDSIADETYQPDTGSGSFLQVGFVFSNSLFLQTRRAKKKLTKKMKIACPIC